jgi:hypothetical protein
MVGNDTINDKVLVQSRPKLWLRQGNYRRSGNLCMKHVFGASILDECR